MTALMYDRENPWEVTTRTIVYAAIGAALYAITAQFQFPLPGTANVFLRPSFALVPFFGFAFGPIVGLFVGLVGNAIADQISGWGLLTSWNWSLANGLAGLIAGLAGYWLAGGIRNRVARSAVAAAIGVVIGFLFVLTDIWLGTAEDIGVAMVDNYIPVVIGNLIVSVILVPILVAAWEPVRESIGR
ncbi:MAG TPA: ECF transporter S component [Candidatus Limnocylindria bacterium]|nr:ECF transporter S component [Candidatus Limnocylindria bacterium]